MRNLLLLLLLANVLYFMWQEFAGDSDEVGVDIIEEGELGPPLRLVNTNESQAAPAGTDAADGDAAELSALVGRSCVTVGPFREIDDAETALADFQAEELHATIRTTQGEVFVGHWVQIRNVPDRASADDMLKTLKDGGLTEAYMVRTDDEGIKISLGLFDDMSGAERIELQAESLGLTAEITERMRDATVFYVDIGLPPGRGAGRMIEDYGEDRVLLRNAARCPRAG